MTKEELEKEARFRTKGWKEQENCIQAYLAGAVPREKQIEELEKENKELKKGLSVVNASNSFNKEQLTEAKDIIKALLKHTHGQNLNTQNDFDLYLGRIKQAYLAGLKVGRPKWHDLRKDPNDLPEERGNYILCFIGADGSNGAGKRCKTIAFFDPDFMEWSEEDNLDDIPYFRNKKVLIAWCEIPKFEE